MKNTQWTRGAKSCTIDHARRRLAHTGRIRDRQQKPYGIIQSCKSKCLLSYTVQDLLKIRPAAQRHAKVSLYSKKLTKMHAFLYNPAVTTLLTKKFAKIRSTLKTPHIYCCCSRSLCLDELPCRFRRGRRAGRARGRPARDAIHSELNSADRST